MRSLIVIAYVTAPNRPFVWVRARILGGRVAVPGHGRQYYRLGPEIFSPCDGLSAAWPLRPGELDPWYAFVERRLDFRYARQTSLVAGQRNCELS